MFSFTSLMGRWIDWPWRWGSQYSGLGFRVFSAGATIKPQSVHPPLQRSPSSYVSFQLVPNPAHPLPPTNPVQIALSPSSKHWVTAQNYYYYCYYYYCWGVGMRQGLIL